MKTTRGVWCTFSAVLLSCLVLGATAEREHFHHDHSMNHHHMTEDEKPVVKRVNKAGACPKVEADMLGICVEDCTGDSDCEGAQKCCKNGCGKQCQKPVEESQCSIRCTKIYDPVCGIDGVTYGSECALREVKCSRNQDFIEVKLEGECHAPRKDGPCDLEYQSAMAHKEMHMVGHMIPQCDQHGYFKPMQCSGSTGSCWCVTSDGSKLEIPEDLFINSDEDCMKAMREM